MTDKSKQPSDEALRQEQDTMGQVSVPGWAYYGAQTQRAVENFQISPYRLPRTMIKALGLIKKHAAAANSVLGLVPDDLAQAVQEAADQVIAGSLDEHFPLDIFQTGSGTSSNMNTNEVIANLANRSLGQALGSKTPVHPNDIVNRGQSSNDVFPSAVHIADRLAAEDLLSALKTLYLSLDRKADELAKVVKLGRTHLQDAVPMTLGQEFAAFAVQIDKNIGRIQNCLYNLEDLPLGGTAIGTGLNCHPDFPRLAVEGIGRETGIPFRPAANKFEGIAARDAQVELMGALNTLATSLMKIANDLRLLASGPRGALGEIVLPSLQPGSSIMPGKVNPVIPEMVIQAAAFVCGKAVSVTIAGQNSPLQLNMMNPLIAHETLTSMEVLTNTCTTLAEKAIDGLEADAQRCEDWISWSLALVTPLATRIGYDKASALAYRAYREHRKIRDILEEEAILAPEELDEILDPRSMI
ncbi:class II fumarate hydratase [Spirochaeta lutea]|nr:class II fumarate hydratase [Spirochaeta lutea]